jgi:hypothetical protein
VEPVAEALAAVALTLLLWLRRTRLAWREYQRRFLLSMRWGAYARHRGAPRAATRALTQSYPLAFHLGWLLQGEGGQHAEQTRA